MWEFNKNKMDNKTRMSVKNVGGLNHNLRCGRTGCVNYIYSYELEKALNKNKTRIYGKRKSQTELDLLCLIDCLRTAAL